MSFFRNFFDNCLSIFVKSLPSKSYTFEFDQVSSRYDIRLKQGNEYSHCHKYPQYFEAFFTKSQSENEIACLMIKPFKQCKYTILFNHGGTVDLGHICNFLFTLGKRLECNIFVYDYSGFGQSTGRPIEKAVYADAETALSILLDKYKLKLDQIIIYGQSLGTAPTLYLATKHQIKGIILHSSYLSMAKLYLPKQSSGQCPSYDVFKNVEMIEQVEAQVLFIHGTKDKVVPIAHAKELFEKCSNPVNPLWVDNGGHNDLYTFESYLTRLKRYVQHDLN